jgi:hypothetical protein
MKLQPNKNVHNPNGTRQVNPIRDIMTSEARECVQLPEEDMETIRQLIQNPPPPTPELIEMLKQNPRSR